MGCEYTSSNRHPSVYKHRHESREWAAKKGCPLKNNAAWHSLPGHRVPAEGFQRIESKGKRSFFSYRYTGVQDMPRIQTVRAQQQELPVMMKMQLQIMMFVMVLVFVLEQKLVLM